jgi:uncharacterized protein (TIGR00730 family)
MKSIAVFCGSKNGSEELFAVHARQIGELLVQYKFGLVYGGSNQGLMTIVADAVLENGGQVTGVMPERLAEWDHSHKGLTELMVVADMHVRKLKMYELCSAAIILPGGFGTMDELFEILAWNQLAIHDLPVFILNSGGFYTTLYQMMQVMHMAGFLREPLNKNVQIFDVPETLMEHVAEKIKQEE